MNFNLQKELSEQDGSEWRFGALSQPGIVSIPPNEREDYLPLGETQFDAFADFTDCASRSPVNHTEALFTYHYRHDMLPENKKWLEDKGYVVWRNGIPFIEFSDRYIALLSGTTRDGNSLKAPIEAIRTQGLIPKKLLPKEDWMKWDDYYDATKITSDLKGLGQEFRLRFKIEYEQVAQIHFGEVLKDDMLGVAGHAWPVPVNGIYPETDGQINHAFLIYNLPKFQIFDNYLEAPGDYTKNLSPSYKLYEYGYRVYLASENAGEQYNRLVALYQQLVIALTNLLNYLKASKVGRMVGHILKL